MSISTYTELQTAVASWAHRTDLNSLIPDFIRIAENRIKSMADVRGGEIETTLACTPSSQYIALPAGFKSPIALWIGDINPREELQQLLPESLPVNSTPNRPMYWAVDGSNIKFQCPANQAYPIVLRYETVFELSDSNPTNYILTNYQDVYLFGALVELASYTADDAALSKWESKFQNSVQLMSNQETSNTEHVPLRTEFGQISKRRFNVYRGY